MKLDEYRFQFKGLLDPIPKISLLGIRGYSDSSNQMDIYNDLIISCIDGILTEFVASVDPGAYYVKHPINPHGCARLQAGLWWYTIGEHHTHQALVQLEEVTVDRLNQDGKRTGQESGYFGVNLHSGGPEYLVGRFSAGCQIIRTHEAWLSEWLNFYLPIANNVEDFGQKRIPYLLIDKIKV